MVSQKHPYLRVPVTEAALRRERRAKQNNYQFLHRLSMKTEDRERLTMQLIYLVNDVANGIAEQVDLHTKVRVKGVGVLYVVQWTSNIESRNVLVYGDPKDDLDKGDHELRCAGAAFGFNVTPGSRFFFNGDLSAQGRAASRNNYISFALHVAEVVAGFEVKQDVIIDRLIKAFTALRHMVGST